MSVIRKLQPDGTHWVRGVPAFVGLAHFSWMILGYSEEEPAGADLNVCRK